MAKPSLRNNLAYSVVHRAGDMFFLLANAVVLGRLLAPEDFGKAAVVLAVYTMLLPLLESGLKEAFVRSKDIDDNANNRFFTVNLLLGCTCSGTIVLAASAISIATRDPVYLMLGAGHALAILLGTASRQRQSILMRACDFRAIMYANLASAAIGIFVATGAAVAGWGAETFVFRIIARAIVLYVAFRLFVGQTFRMTSFAHLKKMKADLFYALGVALSRLLGGIWKSFDVVLFGASFAPILLAYYSRASQLNSLPDAVIRLTLSTTLFARLGGRDSATRQSVLTKSFAAMFVAAATPCLLCAIAGNHIICLLMGPQWAAAGPYVCLFGIWGTGKVLHGICSFGNVLQGTSHRWAFAQLLPTGLFIATGLLFSSYGSPLAFTLAIALGSLVFWGVALCRWIFTCYGSSALRQFLRTALLASTGVLVPGLLTERYLPSSPLPTFGDHLLMLLAVSASSLLGLAAVLAVFEQRGLAAILGMLFSRQRPRTPTAPPPQPPSPHDPEIAPPHVRIPQSPPAPELFPSR